MQFSAVLYMYIVKTYLNCIFTNDLKRKENFAENVHSYRPSLFNHWTKSNHICWVTFVHKLDMQEWNPQTEGPGKGS